MPAQVRWWHAVLALVAGIVGGAMVGVAVALALPMGIDLTDQQDPRGDLVVEWVVYPALLVTVLFFARVLSRMSLSDLGLRRPDLGSLGAAGWTALIVSALLVALVAIVSNVMPQRDETLGFGISVTMIGFVVANGVMAPVVEELAFRGYLYAGFRVSLPMWAAATLVGAAFGATHLLDGYAIEAVVLLGVLGATWCVLRDRTGSIVPGVLMHAVYNALILIGLTGQPGASLAMLLVILLVCSGIWLNPGARAALPRAPLPLDL
jgi:CAAX protease family protein